MNSTRLTSRSSSFLAYRQLRTLCGHLRMSSTSSSSNAEVFLETKNNTAVITLNRPKALNALNLNMIRLIHPALQKWEEDSSVGLIVMKGAGERAFCAGGDVRAIAEAGLRGDNTSLSKEFFREEYMLNHAIGTLKTPYVALINGITMGGGVGLSIHGKFRVATERTVFAMPETAIGLFPDVGGGHALPKLKGKLGLFLALTGYRLKGYDVKHAGVATHFVSSKKLPELESSLLELSDPHLESVQKVLDDYDKTCSIGQSEFVLEKHTEQINRCFDRPTVEEIMTALREDGSEWAGKQVETLNKMSPLSMKVTLQQLKEGAKLNLGDCLKMEHRLSQRFMEDKDFYEGIRAVLIDKDNSPKWSPSTLEGVSKDKVDSYFKPLGDKELLL